MRRPNRFIFIVLAVAAAGAAPAAAQSRPPRFEISANVGALAGESKFKETETYSANVETATLTVNHGSKTPVAFDVGAAVRIVPKLWVGVQYAVAGATPGASIDASIPHPLRFNAPRTVQGSASSLAHNEQNAHIDLMYALPLRTMDLEVMAGPTIFNVKEDFVTAVSVNETYPFDTATFASATTKRVSKGALGLNAGVDVSRALSPHVGVGGVVRYSHANVKFSGTDIASQTVKAGGVEAAAGVRVRF